MTAGGRRASLRFADNTPRNPETSSAKSPRRFQDPEAFLGTDPGQLSVYRHWSKCNQVQ
jgi:hypothetical protein